MKKNNLLPIITKDKNVMKYISLMGQIGAVMVFSVLIFLLIAYFVGKRFDILGIMLPIGVLLGVFSGFYSVYKLLKNFFEEKNEDN